MAKKKEQSTIYLHKETYNKMDSLVKSEGLSSRNQLIEEMTDFYFGYKNAEISQDFLCSVFGQKVDGIVGLHSDIMRRNLFNLAVEVSVATKIMSNLWDIPKDEYDRLRVAAVNDVKSTKGIVGITKSDIEKYEKRRNAVPRRDG